MNSRNHTSEEVEQRIAELEESNSFFETLLEGGNPFRLVTETIEDVFWVSTPGITKMMYVSSAYDRIWRSSRQRLYKSPKRFLESLHPEDLGPYLSIIDAYHAKGKPYQCEYRIQPDPPSIIWIQERGFPIFDDRGYVQLMTGLCTDITDKKNAEKTIQENEKRFRQLFENIKSGVAVYEAINNGEDFLFKDFNKAAENIDQISREDVLGRSVKEVFQNVSEFGLLDVLQRVWRTGRSERHPTSLYKDDRIAGWRDNFVYKLSSNDIVACYDDTTKEKQAEKALIEAKQKLEMVIEFLPDPIFVIDRQGVVQMWNKAIQALTGIRSDEILGRGDYEYARPFYGCRRPLLIDLVLNWDEGFKDKYIFLEKRSDGVIVAQSYHPELNGGIYLFSTASILYDADGTPSGAIESLRDISELKRVEIALRDSELKFRNLFNSIRDAILVADTNRNILGCNPAFSDLFGYSESEILGKPTLFVYESKEQFIELGQELKENIGNPQFMYTVRYRKKSGAVFPGETGIYYLRDAKNDITGFIGLIRNIEDRLRSEENLRRSKDRLKSLVDNLFDAIIVTNQDGVIWFANPAAKTLFGKKTSDIIGMDFGFPVVLEESFDISIVQQDGSLRQVEARATITDWQGKSAYLISLHDITDRVLAEQERDEINLQLQQSQKIESVGRLAGGVAHDFNNMLSIILGYGQELVRSLHQNDPLYECASEIVEAGRRSAALTRQLLAFSRKQALQPEVLNLNYIVKNIEKVLHRLIGEDIELITVLAPNLERVEVDPGQIEQIIMNLAVNARDAMPTGGKLTIKTENGRIDEQFAKLHAGAVPGSYTILSVTDTGHGMDNDTRQRAFEPFFTTKDRDRGTGLGLSTVYGIVKQSGGYIWLYSEPGRGAAFKIYLPHTTNTPSEENSRETDDATIQGNKELILVVEDEPSLRKLSTRVLQELNYKVTAAANGGEAILLVEENKLKPDLLLTDVVMPGMGGKVLVDRLRKTLPDLQCIFMSGYTDDAIVQHGSLDKGTPFIQKPFTTGTLGKKIHSLLNGLPAK